MIELKRRIETLEGQIQRLSNDIKAIPRQGTTSSSGSVIVGALPASLKKIMNLGFVWNGNLVNVKVIANSGISLTAGGLSLNQQGTIAPAAAITLVDLLAGGDSINRTDANTKLATLKTEIDLLKDAINGIISALETGKIFV